MAAAPLVYIVVLNYNGLHINARCLYSVLNQTYQNLCVLFVDNASTDGSLADVKGRFGTSIDYIENEENLFFAGGNNVGIEHAFAAGADYLFILNNDTKLEATCVASLVDFMQLTPEAGGCQPLLLQFPSSGKQEIDADALIASAGICVSLSGRCWDAAQGDNLSSVAQVPKQVDGITGGAMFLRADAIKKVGSFDESYLMYFEDTDLSFRLIKAGYSLSLVPSALVLHSAGTTVAQHAPVLRIRQCETNSYRLILAHFPSHLLPKALLVSMGFSVSSFFLNLCRRQWAISRAIITGSFKGIWLAIRVLPDLFFLDRTDNYKLVRSIRSDVWYPPAK